MCIQEGFACKELSAYCPRASAIPGKQEGLPPQLQQSLSIHRHSGDGVCQLSLPMSTPKNRELFPGEDH